MTLFGNPDAYEPSGRVTLDPDDAVTWDLSIHPRGFEIEDQFTRLRPLLSGEYRFVYWGIAEADADAVLATRFPVAFERGR
ncbi:hypothetical protein [Natrononativus amylolyticus]|uniref:hypothetical protein n=1 Tax=Natrononativus amylolyticus TaxID=2963434 RepID=UPI0020CB72FA|nr:hypothetical protein [Natrononativus amylolyticus]